MRDDEIASPVDLQAGQLKKTGWEDRLPDDSGAGEGDGPANPLDSEQNQLLHSRLISYYQQELDRQSENRREMALDEDFYDNIQWDAEDARILKERGQMPLVYNVIASTVNWVLGTEKRSRSDWRILPRRKDGGKAAERKTQLMKYLADVNRSVYSKSDAFEDAAKVGIGWLECGVRDDADGEPIYDRHESWRNILWDSAGTKKDASDWRYIIRVKNVDLDVAAALAPDRIGLLEEAVRDSNQIGWDYQFADEAMDAQEDYLITGGQMRQDAFGNSRDRLRLIEVWFRKVTKVKKLRGGEFAGEIFDQYSPGHMAAVQSGQSVVIEKTAMRMHVAIMTTKGLLYLGESPYRHNDFPFTPIFAYRRGRNLLPYGMIRGMRDIQADINKRASKALHIMSTNKVIMDEGAVDDLDEFREEVARPDAIIVKKTGKELTLNAERELADAHLNLMSRSIAMIQSQSGVTDEAMGKTTNATAGIAIQRRQEQAGMATAGLFDNLRLGSQVHGEKRLSLIEQFMSEEKQFRITNSRGSPEYVTINDGLPENDITRTKADFVITESDWRATIKAAQTEELFALLQQLAPVAPQVALVMLDLIVEGMDLPSREELVNRIRQVTGMRDPDQEEPTPEDMAREQAQQEQAAMQKRAAMAQIAKDEAQAAKLQSDAQRNAVTIQDVQAAMAGKNVATQSAALDAALKILAAPLITPTADMVLRESGFKSQSEVDEESRQLGVMAGEDQARQQQAAQLQQQQAQQQAMQAQRDKEMNAAQQDMDPAQAEQMRQQQRAATRGLPIPT